MPAVSLCRSPTLPQDAARHDGDTRSFPFVPVGRLASSTRRRQHVGNARTYTCSPGSRSARVRQVLLGLRTSILRIKPWATQWRSTIWPEPGLDWDEGPDRGGPHGLRDIRTRDYRLPARSVAASSGHGGESTLPLTRADVVAAASAALRSKVRSILNLCRRTAKGDGGSGRAAVLLLLRTAGTVDEFTDGFLGNRRV